MAHEYTSGNAFFESDLSKKKSSWNVERLCNRKCFSCLWWYWFGIWVNMSFSITSSQESLFSSLCTNCERRGVWCGIKFSQHLWIYLLDNVLMLYFQGEEATRKISVVGWRFLEGRGCLKEDGGVFRVGTGTFKETVLHDNVLSWKMLHSPQFFQSTMFCNYVYLKKKHHLLKGSARWLFKVWWLRFSIFA